MKKDKIKLSFEVDRFKVIKMLAKNCESAEEYNEMMKIIDGTDEVVREDASLESTHCLLILDRLLHNNENLALRKRLESEDETLNNGEGGSGDSDNDGDGNVKCIEIKGNVAKDIFDKLASLAGKGKEDK